MAKLTFNRGVPKPGPLDHGLQFEGLCVINTVRQDAKISYRKLLSDELHPTPAPSAEVYEISVPLTLADIAAISAVVFARAALVGMADGALVPSLISGMPEPPVQRVAVSIQRPGVGPMVPPVVARLVVVPLTAVVSGCEDQSVRWTLLDGGGSLSAAGEYTAPDAATKARILAVSVADGTASAELMLVVS